MKVLIVDDEPEVNEIVNLAFSFHRPEFQIVSAANGWDGLRKFESENPDIIILDLAMPGLSGFELTRKLRERSAVPIIMLTAKGLEDDKVQGLELGADDYVVKPFGPKELMARVDAVMRRVNAHDAEREATEFNFGPLHMAFNQRLVTLEGRTVELTPTEYGVLFHLVNALGRVVTQEELLAKVWGPEYREEVQYLKVYIRRVRDKLGDDPENPRFIKTVRGVGYMFPAKESVSE
jgi:DNA-binding response OmpR family regulator